MDSEPLVTPSRRVFLTASASAVAATGASLTGPLANAEDADVEGSPTAQRPDAELRAIMRELDERRIEATVGKLASFGTRHTLSTQDDPKRGIGAARDWIFAEMRRYAAASGGRMTVEPQSYIQQPVPRIPAPTRITNIIATLRGSSSPNRVYVVSGHYDSRASDVMDATSDAPGADDDASGVAVVMEMEMARVMATRQPRATM